MRYYRTRLLQTACRVHIGAVHADNNADNLVASIEREINAGNYIADILAVPLGVQARLAERGLLLNLRRIPFINLRAEHYNQSAINAATINGNLYSIVSDAVFEPGNIHAVFYNKELARRYNLPSPAQLHINGEWTYDNIFALGRGLNADINAINASYYLLGFEPGRGDIINNLFIGAGGEFYKTCENNFPLVTGNNNLMRRLTDIFADITARPDLNFFEPEPDIQRGEFMRGNILFSVSTLDFIPAIAEIDFDWGLLPMPSVYGGDSPVISSVSRDSLGLSVLRGTPNTELSGFITEAISVASHQIFREAYIHEQFMYTLRDVYSARNLHDIVNANNAHYNQYSIYGAITAFHGATMGVLTGTTETEPPPNYDDGDDGEDMIHDPWWERHYAGIGGLRDFFASAEPFFRN
jgi:hypothetical protein